MARADRVETSAEVWAQVRLDYLAGKTARECWLAHGVQEAALRARAQREGWRRDVGGTRARGAGKALTDDEILTRIETVNKGLVHVAKLVQQVERMPDGSDKRTLMALADKAVLGLQQIEL